MKRCLPSRRRSSRLRESQPQKGSRQYANSRQKVFLRQRSAGTWNYPEALLGACGTLTIKSPHRLKATEARVSLINKPNFWPFLRCFPVSIAPRWAVWQG